MVGNAECQVRAVDNFVTFFNTVRVGGRVDFFVVETKAVVETDGGRDKRERCSEQEGICVTNGKFLLVLCNLPASGKFMEVSNEVLVFGVGLGAKSVDFFVEESVTGFAGYTFCYV